MTASRSPSFDPVRFVSPDTKGFVLAFAVYLVPSLLLALVLSATGHASPAPLSFPGQQRVALELMLGVVLVPLLETALLVWPTVVAASVGRWSAWRAAWFGAAPIVLLHALSGGLKPIAVAWAFAWSARCYLALREARVPFWVRYGFVAALHGLGNAFALTVILWPL